MPTIHSPTKKAQEDVVITLPVLEQSISKIVADTMEAKFSTLSSDFLAKISGIVDKCALLEQRQDKIEERIDTVASDLQCEITAVREEIKEQSRRMHKIMNIVLMGVPETCDGIKTAENIMKVILPSWKGPIPDVRVGDPNRPNKSHPRPLRITCSSAQDKATALKNCILLKGRDEFKTISVRRDLTKQQQQEWKTQAANRMSRMTTRSHTSSKRKLVENGSPSPSNDDGIMDTIWRRWRKLTTHEERFNQYWSSECTLIQ
ncbi:hypothetical protein Fcan01_05536 [Folsomia candida]|uniref:Uncharacterized protein n=1 Tax=Folsomia candida TaxID=158441 RepID=A0A226ESE1_FOLCA|nr:hypothetical protein Fcan01_05536 [Folsomia candida]